jgi:cold shock CspA family protein
MAKPKETFNKKDKEKKRLQKRKEKEDKMEERRANTKKGKSLEDMMAYIDENGNITDKPQDPRIKRVFKQEDIRIGVPEQEEVSAIRTGVVAFFNNEKGFGFINDKQTGERIFVHVNNLTEPIAESNKVTFEVEMGARGPVAINITKLP